MLGRRDAVMRLLFGAGLVGLRSLASGVPASVLLRPRRAMAANPADAGDAATPSATNPQFVIYSTSFNGDPVNCNAPGTYDDPGIEHPTDPSFASTPMTFGARTVSGAKIWSTLPAQVLARTCFFHHGTYTIVHPDEVKVLGLEGQVAGGDMLCSFMARFLAPALGTVRPQPLSLGGEGAIEAIYYQGQPQAFLTPTTLASVLASPTNGLGTANLTALRDQTLDALNAYGKSMGNTAQKDFIDQYATSVTQLRTLQQGLLGSLSAIKDNSQDSQIQAAIILFQMKVTPVVAVHVSFGGDNHGDPGLASEISGHQAGVASIATMMQGLASAGLQDKVTFVMSNVFGRTMVNGYNASGRQHNDRHHVTVIIGSGVQRSVIGGPTLEPGAAPGGGAGNSEYGALPIDSSTGLGSASGDIAYGDTLASMGKTVAAAVGLSDSVVAQNILSGTAVKPALAP
jgi:Protein of unknown function (DUF1501)